MKESKESLKVFKSELIIMDEILEHDLRRIFPIVG